MRHVSLTDGVLVLRPPRPGDLDAIVAAVQDPEIPRWTSVPSPYGRADGEEWLGVSAPAGWASGKEPVWHVCAADDPDLPLASIGLHHLDLDTRTAEVGYWTAAPARGRGLTSDALRLLCCWAFDELRLERIGWQAYVGNDASLRVALKVGFVLEGTTRGRLVGNGRRHDGWIAGLLPSDLVDLGRPVTSTWTEAASSDADPADADPADADAVRAHGVRAADGRDAAVAPPDTEITAGAVHLRPWRDSDGDEIAAAITDPEILQWNWFAGEGDTEAIARSWLRSRADWSDGKHASFATTDSTTGELLGGVSLHSLDLETRTGEIGYWAAPAARGKGLTRTAVGAATRWGFAVLGLERLELWHALENEASCGVAVAAGYAHEATTRASYRYGDRVRHDEHLHGRLATD